PQATTAAEPSQVDGGPQKERRYGPTDEQLARAHEILARLEAEGVIKPFVVRYPSLILDDGTVLDLNQPGPAKTSSEGACENSDGALVSSAEADCPSRGEKKTARL
ncbi:hypothetical protein C8A01DRAFT_14882, partial [Parachaetomium inaequale]